MPDSQTEQLDLEQLLAKMIDIDTTNPPGNEADLADFLQTLYPDLSTQRFNHSDRRASLVLKIPGHNPHLNLAFMGHMDTVPIPDVEEWTHPPLQATVQDGYLYGRGAVDMKGGLASMALVIQHYRRRAPSVNLLFCFTADEEDQGIGVLSLMEAGVLDDLDFLIIPEPTDEHLALSEKGALWLEIAVGGIAAHASQPDKGINALELLLELVESIKAYYPPDRQHDPLGVPTLSLTCLAGGNKTNVLPSSAIGTLDIRSIPGIHHDQVVDKALKKATTLEAKHMGSRIEIRVLNNRPAIETDPCHPLVRKLQDAADINGLPPEIKGMSYYTDASQIIPRLGMPFAILGPGYEGLAHQKDERVKIQSVRRVAQTFIDFVESLGGVD